MPASFGGFARRLQLALDYSGFVKGRSRTAALAERHNVSRETARKWLNGMAIPELERMVTIAVHTGVHFEWLATGRGQMSSDRLSVHEPEAVYSDSEDVRLIALVRSLPPPKRRALAALLDTDQ